MIALAGLSLVGAACNSAGTSASRAQFRRGADAVCTAADAKAAKVVAPPAADGPGIAATVASIVAIDRTALHQLTQLIRPSADSAAILKWFADVRRTIDATAAVGTASAKGDFAAAAAARDRGTGYAATADAFARSFGLDACATPPAPTNTVVAPTDTTPPSNGGPVTSTAPGTND